MNKQILLFGIIISILLILFSSSCKKETNEPPCCTIIGPLASSEFIKGDTVSILVNANDPDGNIVEVVISVDGSNLCTLTTSPYSYKWATVNADLGDHILTARAKDNENATSDSDPLTVSIIATLPILKTKMVSSITGNTAACGGIIITDGGASLTAMGVCWSTSQDPTTADNITTDNTSGNSFISSLSGLTANTTYYVRAYATNSIGTAYGSNMAFSAIPPGQVTDIDGNTYNTITIGTQVWMAENLKTTKYDNGDEIGTTVDPALNIADETTPKYQWAYDGEESNVDIYGRLYTWWAAVDNRNICPTDWHVPTDEEWMQLESALGMSEDELEVLHEIRGTDEGGKMKSTGTTYWESPNKGATNESGFSALPGGNKVASGHFKDIESITWFWCSSENDEDNPPTGFFRALSFEEGGIGRCSQYKCQGFSIRCVKDSYK